MRWSPAHDDQQVVLACFDDQQAFSDIETLLGQQARLRRVEDAEIEAGADAVAVGGRVNHRAGAVVDRHRPEIAGQGAGDRGGTETQVDLADGIGEFRIEPQWIGLTRLGGGQDDGRAPEGSSIATRSQAEVAASAGRARITTMWMTPPSTSPAITQSSGADHRQASRMMAGRLVISAPRPEALEVSYRVSTELEVAVAGDLEPVLRRHALGDVERHRPVAGPVRGERCENPRGRRSRNRAAGSRIDRHQLVQNRAAGVVPSMR